MGEHDNGFGNSFLTVGLEWWKSYKSAQISMYHKNQVFDGVMHEGNESTALCTKNHDCRVEWSKIRNQIFTLTGPFRFRSSIFAEIVFRTTVVVSGVPQGIQRILVF